MSKRWTVLVGLFCIVGCGGAAEEDGSAASGDVGEDVGHDVGDVGSDGGGDDVGDDPAMCFVNNFGIGDGAIRIDLMTRPTPSNRPDKYTTGFQVAAVLKGAEMSEAGGTELVLLLEGEHLMRVEIPHLVGADVSLPALDDELEVTWGCDSIFCTGQRVAITTASGELVFEGGYILPVTSEDFILEYSPEPSGEPCEVRDEPAEGCWRVGTPMHVNIRGTRATVADGESEEVALDGGRYYVSVLESIEIEGNCRPSETYWAGAVAFIVAVE